MILVMLLDSLDLIDTLWNVKTQFLNDWFSGNLDLIDTLWNVKRYFDKCMDAIDEDLIDTLWNVKFNLETLEGVYG